MGKGVSMGYDRLTHLEPRGWRCFPSEDTSQLLHVGSSARLERSRGRFHHLGAGGTFFREGARALCPPGGCITQVSPVGPQWSFR